MCGVIGSTVERLLVDLPLDKNDDDDDDDSGKVEEAVNCDAGICAVNVPDFVGEVLRDLGLALFKLSVSFLSKVDENTSAFLLVVGATTEARVLLDEAKAVGDDDGDDDEFGNVFVLILNQYHLYKISIIKNELVCVFFFVVAHQIKLLYFNHACIRE